jgi:hypothetical protein
MNAWIYKMVGWHRRFHVAAEQARPCDSQRTYWDRRSRTWGQMRQPSYVFVVGRGPTHQVARRPGC